MDKDISHRIAFYLQKVTERRSHPRSKKLPRKYTYRSQRLLVYKKLMNQLIVEGS
ncbi:hypothetical protein [Bacillus sp. AG4(2022)]|uniref:hypothetical protein n=1 Tax=Bacillus sp. AG4(2022) TaxID=2962594 RepID=UPI002882CAD2|nr:hypothetical protein [Bacillus sp. AG4(2022)]MDT0163859.1 hypothetical protein [Bacillus sp. AG4(2022)]